jgi:hypothetical protein
LLGRDLLQAPEQRVGRGVTARQGHAQPAEERSEEREKPARRGQRERWLTR